MAKIKLEIKGFDSILKTLKQLDGDVKKTAENALISTHKIVTKKAQKGIGSSSLPAKGKYSTGRTKRSLRTEAIIEWERGVASVKVGFNIKEGGLASIFLMYGTPRMKKDQALYDAFFGKKTLKEISEAQSEVFWDEITRLGLGG